MFVSTRPRRWLVQAMGLSGISKSTVSKLCKDIRRNVVGAVPVTAPLTGEWPYLLDSTPTYLKVRQGGRIVTSPPQ